ncbi:MAG: hypothetical protein AMJ90_03455 [candidate division Zixibacteria bacterium SM23_73_2]|nr:MAG: hypothetical protein AMJ90_03455 [candidate division Zixibacteria bacterium SM23_73_2]
MSITTIFDNYSHDKNLRTGWGFSCLVEVGEKKILFDTGADGKVLLDNMKKMDLNPGIIDSVFLSHDHWDHTGGLPVFLDKNERAKVYFLKSFSEDLKSDIKNRENELLELEKFGMIDERVYTTGEIEHTVPEQAMVIDTSKGLIVITGCAHPGVVEITEKVKENLPKEIFLVLGGFHLLDKKNPQIDSVISALEDLGVQKVAPCHCSGVGALELFKKRYGENFIENGVGKVISF